MTDLVVCSLEAWDDVWRRNQHLVDGLLRRDPTLRVLFVEPSADPAYEVVSRRRPRAGAGLRAQGVVERLALFQPTKWLPRAAGAFVDQRLVAGARRAARRAGFTDPLLWVNDPGWAPLAVETGWRSLYDITDDWLLAHRDPRTQARLAECEGLLMEHCAEVVVCSPALERTKGAVRPVTLIPNAVDAETYRRAARRPADVDGVPYALYVGTLHEDRLDVDLVLQTAQALRSASSRARLVLVGPNALSAANTHRLQADPVVRLLGARPRDQVPAYLQHAHALLVPHVVDDFTDSLDPIKLYEYRAVGRPLVATPVAGFRELAGRQGVTVASGPEFASAVAGLTGAASRRSWPVTVPTWEDRVAAMATVLERLGAAT
ncbi:glycosyltransferase [Luteipulveratus flavus]|uniref:Glycosyltransferase n=1 Tax=Luteipulveratus flavus TaxID=3031728 RepID=A0ABT6CCI1_9MICO|nr:glycosyltransferase [Luteipulveratus sp. YIM 133296]MDF8266481.1 glycosyltransferase [Luteipulveratus sp. YIM 133296]